MALRGGVMTKTKMLLFREASMGVVERCYSKSVNGESMAEKGGRRISSSKVGGDHHQNAEGLSSCWVPHPRSGIYVPKGHEEVMDDVPDGAASFNHTYWLREVDGVDKSDPVLPSDSYFQTQCV